ncbi:tRNA 2-selenouridine(34) synthase MnmH [Phenylobacterium sp.]|uniref:tRNA 2-selenouridine(34) synthase MnmH n=1 Tax=Phenylobacterium sp. TaxID=1871053 RepID=UPI0025CC4E77|nr:tRNA 2-selenouridine(34) synthase MnmH [Phenylobacterium sp.]MCA3734275.1 tRNA 2-selenouridine(34) synthase MnmH [Phenylobacterium sp.]MCA3744888.1 tRNA 2-selenouridine(34) synthase MnmH [Phenylobacterium sp.]
MSGPETVASADAATRARFDMVIDVRSPGEFAEDHVPGAVNLPVLDNAERAEVGTLYVQKSRFLARKVGGAYVARNIAGHLLGALADQPGGFRPLVYCWRGGMRSGAMAHILSQVGWRVGVLAGGYRTYRREVTARLYDSPPGFRALVLDGPTGSGKTEVLRRLPALGVQVLDLEGLAGHRGSLLGALPGQSQPAQKMFESRLLAALEALDLSRPVVIEAESSKVGERMVPPAVWSAMSEAPAFHLSAPPEARAAYLAGVYAESARDVEALMALLSRLPSKPGARRLAEWRSLLEAGDLEPVALGLVESHYDPAYRRSSRQHERQPLGALDLAEVSPAGLDRAAEAVAARLRDL